MAETDRERRVIDEVTKGLIIGGSVRDATEQKTFGVEDPSTGELLCDVADASPEDGMVALKAAHDAQPEWAATAPRERGEILRRAFELITERADDIALIMTLEMGKPLAESKAEITYAAEFFRWFSEEAVRIAGEWKVNATGNGRVLVMRQPIGPCLLITPWNFPLAMGTRKIGPAIAAGCTMVIKPASLTPLTILKLADILAEAGLPDGVLNVVTTTSTGKVMGPLIADGRIRKLSFTGSTEVGQKLIEQSAQQVLKTSMELGGNAPFVVCADADVDEAVQGAMLAKMRNIGEACTAANRFYIHADVAEEFTKKLVDRMSDMKVGRGTEEGVEVGPLVEADQRDKVAELVDDAVQKGATVRTGGPDPLGRGLLLPADGALRRAHVGAPGQGGDLRPGGADLHVHRGRRRDPRRQRHRVRPGQLPVHEGPEPGDPSLRAPRGGDGRAQPGHGLQRRRALRRREAVGPGPRGRHRRHRRVPRDQVRGDERVGALRACEQFGVP